MEHTKRPEIFLVFSTFYLQESQNKTKTNAGLLVCSTFHLHESQNIVCFTVVFCCCFCCCLLFLLFLFVWYVAHFTYKGPKILLFCFSTFHLEWFEHAFFFLFFSGFCEGAIQETLPKTLEKRTPMRARFEYLYTLGPEVRILHILGSLVLSLKIAQTPSMIWSLGPKSSKHQALEP